MLYVPLGLKPHYVEVQRYKCWAVSLYGKNVWKGSARQVESLGDSAIDPAAIGKGDTGGRL